MTNSILYSEVCFVCISFLMLLCFKIKSSVFIRSQRKQFLKVAILNMLFFVIDAIWIFVDNQVFSLGISLNWLLNMIYFILSGFLGLYWFIYSETIQESILVSNKKYKIISWIPVFLLTVLTICSYKTGWLFYIDEHNNYHRGPAFFFQLVTSYGYIIFTALKAYYNSFRTKSYQTKKEMRALAFFVLPTLIAGSLQVVFPGYPIVCVGTAFGILYIYVTLQEQLVSVDALTKLNNRNQLFQYLSAKLAHPVKGKNLYLLIMDIDYFKSINDQFGHIEGDKALKSVADSLMQSCIGTNYFLARYGGDEFIMICELDAEEPIQNVCDTINANIKNCNSKYKLTISIGYEKYSDDIKNQQEFIARADSELYKKKKSREKHLS